MTPEERRARAYAAQAILRDETMNSALDEIEADIRSQWEACWLPRKRDRLWTELRTVRKMRQKLGSYAGQARE